MFKKGERERERDEKESIIHIGNEHGLNRICTLTRQSSSRQQTLHDGTFHDKDETPDDQNYLCTIATLTFSHLLYSKQRKKKKKTTTTQPTK